MNRIRKEERGAPHVSDPISRAGEGLSWGPSRKVLLRIKPPLPQVPRGCTFSLLLRLLEERRESPSSSIGLSHSREFSGTEKGPQRHLIAVKSRRREALSAGKCPRVGEGSSPAASRPATTLGRLIKSAALGPATPAPALTAPFFNYALI